MNRRTAPLLFVLAVVTFMAACSSNKSQPVTIAISAAPPSTMQVGATAQLSATVTNDPSNKGIDWSCTPAASCGTFTPAHTASGVATTYQAPTTAGSIVITATSTDEPSVTATSNVTVNAALAIAITTAPPASLNTSATAQIAATVSNDPSNKGVDWSCAPAGSCGTFTPAHTASAADTSYQAPGTAGTVTITATSTADSTVTKSVTVTVNSAPITVSITTPPPSSVEINGTAQLAATVANDSSNAGVSWSCAPAGSCGTFTPAQTASAAATVYQAPNAAGPVTITATSVAEPTVTASAIVTVSPISGLSNLNGTYTYYANGWDSSPAPYSVVGSIVLDGNGNVTGGEQDYVDANSGTVDTADPINPAGGTITLGADGRGTLTITPTNLGTPETFSVVLVNNDHLLITEFDSSATSAGSMDLQTSPTSVPTGGNVMSLYDPNDQIVLGAVITASGLNVTGGEGEADFGGSISSGSLSGSLTAPDAYGRGTMNINGTILAYYVVGPEVFRLIETDSSAFATGSMYGQGTSAGAFSAASLTGSYAFMQGGESPNNPNGLYFYGLAGQFTTDASATFTAGVADLNEGDANPVLAASLAGSSYTVNADGSGTVTLASALDSSVQNFAIYLVDPTLNIADPNSTVGGGGAILIDVDQNTWGVGLAVPQSSGATFAGNYAFNQDGYYVTSTSYSFFDITGQLLSDGAATLTGNADFNDLDNTGLNSGVAVTGTFTADSGNPGRSTAKINISGSGGISTENITLYQASDGLLFHVDMDSPSAGAGNIAVGVFEKQH